MVHKPHNRPQVAGRHIGAFLLASQMLSSPKNNPMRSLSLVGIAILPDVLFPANMQGCLSCVFLPSSPSSNSGIALEGISERL